MAEKIVTMVDRGDTTTRDRDFADVFAPSGRDTDLRSFGLRLRRLVPAEVVPGHRRADLGDSSADACAGHRR